MKPAPAPNGNRKDPAQAGIAQQVQQPQNIHNNQHQPPPPLLPQPLLANYTLPGVISYLTSEFTNLERFKIMTNLEKSEMKYRIQQLTAEINSLKFLNDKQAVRIRELEEQLASKSGGSSTENAGSGPEIAASSGNLAKSTAKSTASTTPSADYDIPAVDLEVLRASRQKLNRSIKDVYRLLKPPSISARNVMDIPGADHSDYTELMREPPSDEDELQTQSASKLDSIFAKYTLSSDDLLLERKESIEEEANNIIKALEEDADEPIHKGQTRLSLADESDTETVIVDEPEEAHLLIDESELVNSTASPDPPIRLGSIVHIPAPHPAAKVYQPFQHSFVVIQGHTFTAWHRSTQVFTGDIDETLDDVAGAFYLEKKRVLLVTRKSGIVLIEQKSDSNTLRRVVLHKEEKLQVETCAILEFSRVGSNRALGLAYSGKNKEGKSNIVALELKTGQKVTSKPLAQFNSTFIKAASDVTSLHWYENTPSKLHTSGLPKSLLPRKHSKLASVDENASLNFDLLFSHGKLLKISLALKEITDVYTDKFDTVEVTASYALLAGSENITLFDIAAGKVILSKTAKQNARYSLLYKGDPFIVQVDNTEMVVYDANFHEVATSPNCDGTITFSDADFVVVQSKQEVRITAIEGAN